MAKAEPKTLNLSTTESKLLQHAAGDLIPALADDESLLHLRRLGFRYWSKKTEEEFQIIVTVTRDVDDFIGEFDTEEMRRY
jgi:hypothetical protein